MIQELQKDFDFVILFTKLKLNYSPKYKDSAGKALSHKKHTKFPFFTQSYFYMERSMGHENRSFTVQIVRSNLRKGGPLLHHGPGMLLMRGYNLQEIIRSGRSMAGEKGTRT